MSVYNCPHMEGQKENNCKAFSKEAAVRRADEASRKQLKGRVKKSSKEVFSKGRDGEEKGLGVVT